MWMSRSKLHPRHKIQLLTSHRVLGTWPPCRAEGCRWPWSSLRPSQLIKRTQSPQWYKRKRIVLHNLQLKWFCLLPWGSPWSWEQRWRNKKSPQRGGGWGKSTWGCALWGEFWWLESSQDSLPQWHCRWWRMSGRGGLATLGNRRSPGEWTRPHFYFSLIETWLLFVRIWISPRKKNIKGNKDVRHLVNYSFPKLEEEAKRLF